MEQHRSVVKENRQERCGCQHSLLKRLGGGGDFIKFYISHDCLKILYLKAERHVLRQKTHVYRFMYCVAVNSSSGTPSNKFFNFVIPFCTEHGRSK
jgi:hypothetical protein